MRLLVLFLIVLCQLQNAVGQNRTLSIPKSSSGDSTNYWHKETRSRESQIGLPAVEKTIAPFHFRLSTTAGNIVELWQRDNRFQGQVIFWVKDANQALLSTSRFYSQNYTFSPNQAEAIRPAIN